MNRRSRLVFACDAPHGGLTGRGQAFEFDRQAFAPSCFLKPRQEPLRLAPGRQIHRARWGSTPGNDSRPPGGLAEGSDRKIASRARGDARQDRSSFGRAHCP
jgi:hypothetical protein